MKIESLFPKVGAALRGGVFVSLATNCDGMSYALLKLPARPGVTPAECFDDSHDSFLTWEQASAWAKSLGGDLPTRAEAELLRSNVHAMLPEESWTSDEGETGAHRWAALFVEDDMTSLSIDSRAEALAIRRVPLEQFFTEMRAEPVISTSRTAASADELLAGAEACRALLMAINAVGFVQVEPDPAVLDGSDVRRDYWSSEALLVRALSEHGTDPGFVTALSTYLLSVAHDGLPDLSSWTAHTFLTDCDCRGMSELGLANRTPLAATAGVAEVRAAQSVNELSEAAA